MPEVPTQFSDKLDQKTEKQVMNAVPKLDQDVKPETKIEAPDKPQVVVNTKKCVDLHVLVIPGFDLLNLSDVVIIDFHFHAK